MNHTLKEQNKLGPPTKNENLEYCAYNIGNVWECSFPFSIAMACSYKEKASSSFPCTIKINNPFETGNQIYHNWDQIGRLAWSHQTAFHICMLNNCLKKTRWNFTVNKLICSSSTRYVPMLFLESSIKKMDLWLPLSNIGNKEKTSRFKHCKILKQH